MRCEPHDIVKIVCDENQGHIECPSQRFNLTLESAADGTVHGRKRLVEQQHCWLTGQCSRECDALTLAARQFVWPSIRAFGQMHAVQQLRRLALAFGARPMARLVERTIKKPLSELLLFGDLAAGSTVLVKKVGDGLVLEAQDSTRREPEA